MNMISFAKTVTSKAFGQDFRFNKSDKKSISFSSIVARAPFKPSKNAAESKTSSGESPDPPVLSKHLSISSNSSEVISTMHVDSDEECPAHHPAMTINYANESPVYTSDIEIDTDSADESMEHLTRDQITEILGDASLNQDFLDNLYQDEKKNNSLSWYQYAGKMHTKASRKMRKNAIEWLRSKSVKFGFEDSTTFKSMYYFDKLCSVKHINPDHWGLVAAVCLFIAAKFNEREYDIPCFSTFSRQCGFESAALISSEVQVLRALNFKLKVVLPIDFVKYYIFQQEEGVLFADDIVENSMMSNVHKSKRVKKDLEKFAVFFLQIASQSYSFWQYSSSTLAAAVVYAARRSMQIKPYNNSKVSEIYECEDKEIKECFDKLWSKYEHKFSTNAKIYESSQPQSVN